MRNPVIVLACAQAAHEANAAYCRAMGDNSQPTWADAPEWQQNSALAGVEQALNGASPEESHISWSKLKVSEGWVYGPEKDPAKKTHPCLVPYHNLPPAQRAKDALYLAVVRAMAIALNPFAA